MRKPRRGQCFINNQSFTRGNHELRRVRFRNELGCRTNSFGFEGISTEPSSNKPAGKHKFLQIELAVPFCFNKRCYGDQPLPLNVLISLLIKLSTISLVRCRLKE